VGYAGVVFYSTDTESSGQKEADKKVESKESRTEGEKISPENKEEAGFLSDDECKTLLKLSRDALKSFLESGGFKADPGEYNITPALSEKAGVFVTLKKHDKLRGCIGYVEGIKPIWEAVIDNTQNAAFEDPRFPSVKKGEFDDISIEISVMTPLRPINSIDEIKVGTHGLVIRKGFNSGLLLPQVPVEWGWDRDEFLVHICRKAGLPSDAWKSPDAQLMVFSAQVFSEHD
jgi:AmmeMemoRadiSam system protein A